MGCEDRVTGVSWNIWYREKKVTTCFKCTKTGLWMMPLLTKVLLNTTNTNAQENTCDNSTRALAFNQYQTTTKPKIAEHHHQSLFLTPISTIMKALKNNQLKSFIVLYEKILKHGCPSEATCKGHMHMNKKAISMRTKQMTR